MPNEPRDSARRFAARHARATWTARAPSTPPPLPPQAPHEDPIEALGVGSAIAQIGVHRRTASVPPMAMDTPRLDHHKSGGALAIMIAGAAILLTPLFLGRAPLDAASPSPPHAGMDRKGADTLRAAGASADAGVVGPTCDESNASVPEQFIELDAVQMAPAPPRGTRSLPRP